MHGKYKLWAKIYICIRKGSKSSGAAEKMFQEHGKALLFHRGKTGFFFLKSGSWVEFHLEKSVLRSSWWEWTVFSSSILDKIYWTSKYNPSMEEGYKEV